MPARAQLRPHVLGPPDGDEATGGKFANLLRVQRRLGLEIESRQVAQEWKLGDRERPVQRIGILTVPRGAVG